MLFPIEHNMLTFEKNILWYNFLYPISWKFISITSNVPLCISNLICRKQGNTKVVSVKNILLHSLELKKKEKHLILTSWLLDQNIWFKWQQTMCIAKKSYYSSRWNVTSLLSLMSWFTKIVSLFFFYKVSISIIFFSNWSSIIMYRCLGYFFRIYTCYFSSNHIRHPINFYFASIIFWKLVTIHLTIE